MGSDAIVNREILTAHPGSRRYVLNLSGNSATPSRRSTTSAGPASAAGATTASCATNPRGRSTPLITMQSARSVSGPIRLPGHTTVRRSRAEDATASTPGSTMASEQQACPAAIAASTQRPGTGIAGLEESDGDFEKRATQSHETDAAAPALAAPAAAGATPPSGPLEALELYDRLLTEYPDFEHNDQVLYQKARALDELGRTEEAMETMERLVSTRAYSDHYDEVQFRRAEFFFTRRKFREAEAAYSAVVTLGPKSEYYELALYKLGWTLYKQDFYDEAQHRFIALLDYKVSTGYDFDQKEDEDTERRIADTFRVISLSFSNLGGPEVLTQYFADRGHRSYEDRIYSHQGEFYFEKLRYQDAAKTYQAFVDLYPVHRGRNDATENS